MADALSIITESSLMYMQAFDLCIMDISSGRIGTNKSGPVSPMSASPIPKLIKLSYGSFRYPEGPARRLPIALNKRPSVIILVLFIEDMRQAAKGEPSR